MLRLLDLFFGLFMDYIEYIFVIIGGCFSVYFYIKKIGFNVKSRFNFVSVLGSESRVDNIVLENKKDKSVCIYGLYAVIDDRYFLELENFKEPLILNNNGVLKIDTKPFSSLFLETVRYELSFSSKIKLFLKLDTGYIQTNKKFCFFPKKINKNLRLISKGIFKHNGIVYNSYARYILTYIFDNQMKTAFFSKYGRIYGEWSFHYNKIGKGQTEITDQDIRNLIKDHYSEITSYQILIVNPNDLSTKELA